MNPEHVAAWVVAAAGGLFMVYFVYLLIITHLNNRRFKRLLKTLGGTGNDSGPYSSRRWRDARRRQG